MTVTQGELDQILSADCGNPFGILGLHRVEGGEDSTLAVRAFLPGAEVVTVVKRGDEPLRFAARRLREEGFFEALIPGERELFAYELEVTDARGRVSRQRDPYSFWPLMGSYDRYLFNEGTHYRAYDVLGAHPRQIDGVDGVYFAVWAPNARMVSVVGDFNRWDRRCHGMRDLEGSGIWEIFLPHIGVGQAYKYEIKAASGEILTKSDPFAFGSEVPPRTASVVRDLSDFDWNDGAWMELRGRRNWIEEPMAIYELHPGSWRLVPEEGRPLNYRELAHELVDYVSRLGFTHVELLPPTEYPFDGSWGYQVTGYFAPTARFGTAADFAYFVDYCHQHGIGVFIDWVPGHFPKDGHGLAAFDGTALYEHRDARQGEHPDWGTLIFNFGRDEVKSFLLSNALFWLERYHIDGLRVDAVASMLYLDYSRRPGEWVPNYYSGRENIEAIDFLKQLNTLVHARFPGATTIAEESTAWPAVSHPVHVGGLGFGFKWNMGWMNDVLSYMSGDPLYRKYHHAKLTFGMLYNSHENFVLPLSHDEVVHGKASLLGKMPGDVWQKLANLRLLFGFMYGHPGKKLLFMGGEIAQWGEWDYRKSLDWHLLDFDSHRGVLQLVTDLNALYRANGALHQRDADPGGFEWLDCQDVENSVVSFARRGREADGLLIFVCNFTPVVREGYRLGVPRAGYYRELLNTDAAVYGGSNLGNDGGIASEPVAWHKHSHSVTMCLPPLSVTILRPEDLRG